jgi:hypothetical protein
VPARGICPVFSSLLPVTLVTSSVIEQCSCPQLLSKMQRGGAPRATKSTKFGDPRARCRTRSSILTPSSAVECYFLRSTVLSYIHALAVRSNTAFAYDVKFGDRQGNSNCEIEPRHSKSIFEFQNPLAIRMSLRHQRQRSTAELRFEKNPGSLRDSSLLVDSVMLRKAGERYVDATLRADDHAARDTLPSFGDFVLA